jgi:hypothetical protein
VSPFATDVFTPNDFPTYTYVERDGQDFEEVLGEALRTPRQIASVSGPSKSGKSVLVKRVVHRDHLITVSGAEIGSANDFWSAVLDNIDRPESVTESSTSGDSNETGSRVTVGAGVPNILNVSVGQTGQTTSSVSTARLATYRRGGLQEVADVIADSDYVVFIDDFHYIPAGIQSEIARQIKAGAERGIRIIVAVVPHRSDDVVRTNAELRGRVRHVDMNFWTEHELAQIALRGFGELNVAIDTEIAMDLAMEACGSPQLMQTICLQACVAAGFDETLDEKQSLPYDETFKKTVLRQSASTVDYSSLVEAFHRGAIPRGTVRNTYSFVDGSSGDVYRAVLLAIAKSPPLLGFTYAELLGRVQSICAGEAPPGSSIKSACQQIQSIAFNRHSDQRIVEWDRDTLHIVDPYLLFYLRASRKLATLGEAATAV